ncbi:MAG: ribonuclease HII [Bacteroidales bacterium]|nr:ribonuclease HII [Candidatus Colimorpha onthohippi]
MLFQSFSPNKVECGCDEAGRGCLAGPVYAAAVILPRNYVNETLNDSKQLSPQQRQHLRLQIEQDSLAWAVSSVSAAEIDRMNILKASFHAMNLAIAQLHIQPELLLIDGNRFYNETELPYECIVKGDAKYMSIAAASVLAKTYRDDYMAQLHHEFPMYGWNSNKGYPTKAHYEAIRQYGVSPWHRMSYKLYKD